VPVPNVQWKTPDDGQRNCPKHVEFRTRINLEISASVDFIVKKFVTMHGLMNVKFVKYLLEDKTQNLVFSISTHGSNK
jgi:predicted DNA binding CopG/RHH family protein